MRAWLEILQILMRTTYTNAVSMNADTPSAISPSMLLDTPHVEFPLSLPLEFASAPRTRHLLDPSPATSLHRNFCFVLAVDLLKRLVNLAISKQKSIITLAPCILSVGPRHSTQHSRPLGTKPFLGHRKGRPALDLTADHDCESDLARQILW